MCLMQAARDTSDAPSLLCFEGSKAAAAARSARPLDLMIIANRVDAGRQPIGFIFTKCRVRYTLEERRTTIRCTGEEGVTLVDEFDDAQGTMQQSARSPWTPSRQM